MADRPPHDHAYQNMFSHAQMVRDLLCGFVPEAWVSELDFSSLEKISGRHLSDDLRGRESDVIWRLRLRHEWLYVYLLLEFQSRDDRWMALRVLVYTGLLYQDLIRTRVVGRGERLPAVFPIVIYNGRKPWRSISAARGSKPRSSMDRGRWWKGMCACRRPIPARRTY